jgi:hypothetical protein
VAPLALAVCQRRHFEQIGMLEQAHAVFHRQPLAAIELSCDLAQHHRDRISNSGWCYTAEPYDVSLVTTRSG